MVDNWPIGYFSNHVGSDVVWRTPNSLKDSNVSPSRKQQKKEELGHAL
jgi:hypothetical protein